MRNDSPFGMATSQERHGLDFDHMTITLRGREISVTQALDEGILAHDEDTGLMRLGQGYTSHRAEHA